MRGEINHFKLVDESGKVCERTNRFQAARNLRSYYNKIAGIKLKIIRIDVTDKELSETEAFIRCKCVKVL